MTEILQNMIPYDVTVDKGLPGIGPLAADGWIIRDDAFAGQMALRDKLIDENSQLVHSDAGASDRAKAEVLDHVLAILQNRAGYSILSNSVIRPDNIEVALEGDPLITAAQLIQEDLLIHEKPDGGDEHVLTAGVLCFPASWTLAEKVGRPLSHVHAPVASYDDNIARRVQRLFDGIRAGHPLWRFNVLRYPVPDLFHPRSEHAPRSAEHDYQSGDYVRSEHQALVRMPKSGAVLFAIHTYVVSQPL